MSQSATESSARSSNRSPDGRVVLFHPLSTKPGRVDAGLVVDVGQRGFVPLSQLASLGSPAATERGAVPDAVRAYVGKRLPLKVIEADQHRDRLILSERAAAQELRRRRKEEATTELTIGQVLEGKVASVITFGVSEPTTLYHPGDTVRVLVTGVDRERSRISLSIKRLEEGPMGPRRARARYRDRIAGLIHISEIASRRIANPGGVVRPGDLVRVRVVAIEPDGRRLSLSRRQAAGNVVYATRTDQDANV